jgi:DNA-binding transcriptional LysR family regulator
MSDIDSPKIRKLDGSLLLVFQELIRHRRTTVAGKRLGLSQSAISHALARLRELFGDPLFVRRPNGLEPTRHALELAPKIEELIRLANDTMALGDSFDPATTQRHFRLGAPDYVCALMSAPLMKAFEQEAPNARFSFRLLLGREALECLKRDEIDIAIGRFREPLDRDRFEHLLTEEYCVIARRGHGRVNGAIDLNSYLEQGHVLTSVSGDLVGLTDPVLEKLGIVRRIAASVPRFLIALSVVAESDAIATVPRRLALRYADSLGLQVLPVPFALGSFSIDAIARKADDPAIEWLMRQLHEASS